MRKLSELPRRRRSLAANLCERSSWLTSACGTCVGGREVHVLDQEAAFRVEDTCSEPVPGIAAIPREHQIQSKRRGGCRCRNWEGSVLSRSDADLEIRVGYHSFGRCRSCPRPWISRAWTPCPWFLMSMQPYPSGSSAMPYRIRRQPVMLRIADGSGITFWSDAPKLTCQEPAGSRPMRAGAFQFRPSSVAVVQSRADAT
jgi:hypothetical protein